MEGLQTKPLRIGEAARRLGVHIETLRRWSGVGLVKTVRSPTGQRWFDPAEIERVRLGKAELPPE